MNKNTLFLKLEHMIVILGAVLFVAACFKNWNFFYVPNTDIFQYLCDARDYYHGLFPYYVQPQPLYSLLIFSVSFLFSSFSFPEIKAGIAINVFSNALGLYLMWRIAKQYLRLPWRLLLMILLFSHPLFFYTAINTTPEALLWLCVTASLLFYPNKRNLAYVFAVLASLVKYEGFVLLAMVLLTDVISYLQRNGSKKLHWSNVKKIAHSRLLALVAVGCLVIWQISILSYNFSKSGSANFYFQEIQQGRKTLPDWRKVSRLIDLLEANVSIYNTQNTNNDWFEALALVALFGVIALKNYQKKQWALLQSVGFCVGYLFIHLLFPAYNPRYFQPILSFIFLYFCILFQFGEKSIKNSKWLVWVVVFLLTIGWLLDLRAYKFAVFMEADRYSQAEERLAGEWLNELNKEEGQYAVLAINARNISNYLNESEIKTPFSRGLFNRNLCEGHPIHISSQNAHLTFYNSTSPGLKDCQNALCLVHLLPKNFNKVFVMASNDTDFWIDSESGSSCFTKITELNKKDHFVKIYEYQQNSCK